MRYLHFFVLVLLTEFAFAQDSIRISANFYNNTRFSKVVVQKFGIGTFKVATSPLTNNSFTITAPKSIEPGIYRFQYSETENYFVDVIINGNENEIHFEIDANSENRKPNFIKSTENKKWYAYKENEVVLLRKIKALQNFLASFPDQNNKIWVYNNDAYIKLQQLFKKEKQLFIDSNPGFWAKNMVKNQPVYFPDVKKHWKIQDFEAREQFWNTVVTDDSKLQNTPLYTELILDYLRYYMNPEMQFTEEEMVDGFLKSADDIMTAFSKNEDSQKFALQFLQLGFKEMGQENVLQYLDEKYAVIATQCQDDKNKQAFELRMEGYKAMRKGIAAPNITWVTANGKQASLYDLKTDKVLVVFWASWCSHCMEVMPKINEFAKLNQDVAVVAISLDTDFNAYQKQALPLNEMYHYCDYKQWKSKPVVDYYIYGTPTMILLDKDKKIESKFTSEKELFEYFK